MAHLTSESVRRLFVESGALLHGHFQLSSGRHSDQYLEKFRLVENPAVLEPLCEELASRCAQLEAQYTLGPTTAGIILAYCVARHLGIQARFAEPASSGRELRRGQVLPEGARVLIVDDILTTGLSVRECIEAAARHKAAVVGVAVLADRSGDVSFGMPLTALLTERFPSYRAEECPLCARGVPLTKPGSRLSTR